MGQGRVKTPKYTLEVYEEWAVIRGALSTDVLTLLIGLCLKEGFTHLTHNEDGLGGFKLVRKHGMD